MSTSSQKLKIAFVHPDLGIGGAERLVVDAALGLQALGHSIDIYTSHHDPSHCFEETRDGKLTVHYIKPPFPRSFKGKFHILFAHLRQLHLTAHLLSRKAPQYDVFFVDQLSTCIPFLRQFGHTRVVFYCHFPDKLLANGAFVDGNIVKKGSLLKRIYRYPMDLLEEITTRQADIILANSNFTARVFASYFPSINRLPRIVYPGINISAYGSKVDASHPDIKSVSSSRPTLLSLNRFERKKNVALAVQSFATLKAQISDFQDMRLVLAGGYDPRLEDNIETLISLVNLANSLSLTYNVISPSSSPTDLPPIASQGLTATNPQILFLLNFTTSQRTALLLNPSTRALLYTPANEHFGIVPVEAMGCGVPVLACNSGGPTESIIDEPPNERTGWLRAPDADAWAEVLREIIMMSDEEREGMSERAKSRASALFSMDAMARGLEEALEEAHDMGKVDWDISAWWVMVFGFLIAYLVGPLVLPARKS